MIPDLQKKYESICLLRNEGHFKIYNFSDGKAFQPDFVFFLREKSGKILTDQVFIEPEGKHLLKHDQWKADFLTEIQKQFADTFSKFDTDSKSRLVGVPFDNNQDEKRIQGKVSVNTARLTWHEFFVLGVSMDGTTLCSSAPAARVSPARFSCRPTLRAWPADCATNRPGETSA